MPRNKSLADTEYRVIHSKCGMVSSIDFNETKKTIEAHLILGCASINLYLHIKPEYYSYVDIKEKRESRGLESNYFVLSVH